MTTKRRKPRSDRNTPEQIRGLILALPETATGCKEWPGARRNGYALIQLDGRQHYAHRLSWELFHGPIPKGVGHHGTCVLHHCDNRPCVSPDTEKHLFLGTQKDNIKDGHQKGRIVSPSFQGDGHPLARLTEDEVRLIRKLADEGYVQRKIADLFGIEQTMVSAIKRRKRWAHLE